MAAKVLTKSVAAVQVHAMMYKAVVHTALLYGSDIWVVTGVMLTVIEGFNHRVDIKIAGNTDWHAQDGRW